MKHILRIFILFYLGSFLYAQDVTLQLKWKHQFQFAGFYMAKEKGFYQDKGINLTIKELGDDDPVDSVINQESQFGVDDSVLVYERMKGKPVVALFPIYQKSPLVLMGVKQNQKDLSFTNKIVEIPLYSLSSITIKAMLKLSNAKYISKSPTFKLDDLIAQKTDYISSYISNEPYKLKKIGIEPILHSPHDYGIDFYGDMLYTSNKLIDTDPKLVKNFLEASKKGWLYAFEHIDETIDVILRKYNTQNKQKDALQYEAKELKKLADIENFGNFSIPKIQNIATSYVYLNPQKYDLNNLEGFIYKQGSKVNLTHNQKEFLKKHKSFTLCSRYGYYPLTREINGNLDGIAKDIFEKFSKELNIEFEILPIASDEDFMQNIQSDKCDLVSFIKEGTILFPNIKTSKKLFSTTIVAIGNLQSVFIDDFSKEKEKVFYISDKASFLVLKNNYPNLHIKLKKDLDEIMRIVLKDHNSYYLNNKILIEHVMQKYGFQKFKLSGIVDKVQANVALGINIKNPGLLPIINKTIDSFDEKYIDNVIDKYVIKEFTIIENKKYFWYSLVIFLVILFFVYLRYRFIADKNKEIEELNNSLIQYSKQLNEAQSVAKIGSWKYNIVTNNLEWSDETYHIFELDKNSFEVSYEAFFNEVHPDDREKLYQAYNKALIDKQPYDVTHRILMKDGHIKWVKEKCRTTFDENGTPLVSVGTVQDITIEKALEHQIKIERDFISTIIDSANAIIAVIDSEGKMIKINKYGQEFIGYSEIEIASEPYFWMRFLPQNMKDKVLDIITKAKAGRIIKNFKSGWIAKDGTEKIFEWSNTLVQKHDGSMDYIATIGIDVTLKEEIQSLIIKQRQKYKNLMDLSSDAIFIMDLHKGDLIEHSVRVTELLGYSKDELQSLNIMDWDIGITDIKQYQEIVSNIGYEPIYIERIHQRKDSTQYTAAITAVKITLLDEQYLYASVRDITQESTLKLELVKAKELAESANIAKSEFLSNISHEIRTPLNGIIGLTDLVLQTNLDEVQKEYLTRSKKSSKALLYIINDILDFSKIEAGKLNIVIEEFELDNILNTVKSLFEYSALKKYLDFSFYIDKSIPNHLIGDDIRLVQILNNLIGNAIKFTSTGFVALKVKLVDKDKERVKLEFCIEDSGIGISNENQKKLFQSFEQLDSSTTKKYGGTGLGLMITKQLVSLMNGKVWVESEEKVGSKFFFSIEFEYHEDSPCAKTIHNKMSDSNQDDQKRMILLDEKKALLVEDHEANQIIASKLLEQYKFQVKIASDGIEAIAMMKKFHFDIVFMDIQMPNMDGFEATRKIREFDKEVPIVALSAAVMKKDKESARKAGMNSHLAKPILQTQLADVIKEFFSIQYVDEKKEDLEDTPILYGVDYRSLLESVSYDKNLLHSILEKYYNHYGNHMIKFQEFDISSKELKEIIHKLKGVSGNIKADKIYTLCLEFESSSKEYKQTLLKQLENELFLICVSIKENIIDAIDDTKKSILNTEQLRDTIKDLIKDLQEDTFIQNARIEELINSLKNKFGDDTILKLKECFSNYEYEKLITLLKSIKEDLDE